MNVNYITYKSRRNRLLKSDETLILKKYEFNKDNIINLLDIDLEIGFGSGEFIFNKAKKHPQKYFLAAEVYNPGIMKLLSNIENNNIQNIYIYPNDIREILPIFPQNFFSNIYILFPDPWPKRKHHKKRLINNIFLQDIYSKKSNYIHIGTDNEQYATHIQDIAKNLIKKLYIRSRPFFLTSFEEKALTNNEKIYHFIL